MQARVGYAQVKFGVSNIGTELYATEKFYYYKLIVEQSLEVQPLHKELEQLKCTLLDKFVAGGIITKASSLVGGGQLCYFFET
jgi:hypothetical protein